VPVRSLIFGFRFRWVSCQFEVLRRCVPARIQKALSELPESLDQTYERTLQDIDKANWNFSRRLFQCVAAASRPLHIEELAEVLAFDPDAGRTPTSPTGLQPKDSISAVLSTCPNFLSIIQVKGSASIQFSHLSVKEFLTSNRLTETEDIISQYHVSMNAAHTIMAQACLGNLLHLDEKVTNDTLKSFPLAEYAAKHWVDHARFDKVLASTYDHIKRLFDPIVPHLMALVWIYDPEIPQKVRSERPSQPGGTCLHYAALSGFSDLVNSLITELSPDLDARGFFNEVTPLHLASRDGHVGVARVLLEHGADVMAQDADMMTPLHLASGRGHVDVARVLLEYNADVNAQDADDWTALHHASRSGYMDVTLLLLGHGADPTVKDVDESTPLHLASAHGQVDIARALIKNGADVTAQDEEMSTPLHLASGSGHVDIVRLLLERRADANAQDAEGWTPLHQASGGGYVEVARLLLEHSAQKSSQDQYKSTPPHLASGRGHVDFPEALLEYDVDLDAKDESSWTPLHVASQEGHLDVVQLLLAHGDNPDPDAKNGDQQTPLSLASSNGRRKVVEFLLEKGANLNSHDRQKRTPLHGASENGHFDIIFLLLSRGAEVNAEDSHLWTPLHMASRTGNSTVVLELLDYGAEVQPQDDLGWTPLHIASQEGHQGVVRLLLKRHAHVDALETDHETALHLAAYYGHLQVSQVLFDSGANVHALNKNEKRPSDLASAEGHHRLAKVLSALEEIRPVAEQEEEPSQYDSPYPGPSRQLDEIASPSIESQPIAHTSGSSSYAPQVSTHSISHDSSDEYATIFHTSHCPAVNLYLSLKMSCLVFDHRRRW
jgi:ankyrin repeat protein